MIEAKGLYKKYKKKVAVDNLSFTVPTGHITGFLGPNGAGKSTTMRLMLGLDKGRGTTTFNGQTFFELAKPQKTIGALLDANMFHPKVSARNHLLELASISLIAPKRVDEVLELVGLKSAAKQKVGGFSLGMRQRLGLACCVLDEPKYLMLDEPANGLDPEGIAWLRDFLKDYVNSERGILMSSHLLGELQHIADRVVVIGQGKLITESSLTDFISGNITSSVLVRTSNQNLLASLLNKKGLGYKVQGDALIITGTGSSTDNIGRLAHAAKLTVLELSLQSGDLEQAFLDVTATSQEYSTKKSSKKGKHV